MVVVAIHTSQLFVFGTFHTKFCYSYFCFYRLQFITFFNTTLSLILHTFPLDLCLLLSWQVHFITKIACLEHFPFSCYTLGWLFEENRMLSFGSLLLLWLCTFSGSITVSKVKSSLHYLFMMLNFVHYYFRTSDSLHDFFTYLAFIVH